MSTRDDKAPARQQAKEKERESGAVDVDVEVGASEMMPPEAGEIVSRSQETAIAGMRAMDAGAPSMMVQQTVQAQESDIADETDKLGPSFGAFVKAVGLAVAESQTKLDQTLVATAEALSKTQIDVIAVFEQEIDDNGEMTAGRPVLQKLPLVNYIMPTAYQWTRVYLQADAKVQEFNAANGFNIQGKSTSFSADARASYGILQGGFSAGGGTRFATSSYGYAGETSVSRDEAAGSLHMEATLEPRSDIRLPQPFIVQKGPRLKVTVESRRDLLGTAPAGGGAAPVIGRELVLKATLTSKTNTPLTGKQLGFKLTEPLLNYTQAPATSGADGAITWTVRREGAAFNATEPPVAVTATVWFGLVNEQVTFTL
jgi:hypothetical protein